MNTAKEIIISYTNQTEKVWKRYKNRSYKARGNWHKEDEAKRKYLEELSILFDEYIEALRNCPENESLHLVI